MKIVVMGAGAIGGYFGGRLAASGHEVCLIARGAHLQAIRDAGLRIESPLGDLHLKDIRATDDPAEAGTADVVLFLVKNYDVEAAAALLGPVLGPDTFAVTGQNGVSAPDRLGAVIGAGRVVPGAVHMPADIRAPGVIRHSAPIHSLTFGEPDGSDSPRVRALAGALEAAGLKPVVSRRIAHDLWAKFALLSAMSAITALTRLDIGQILAVPETEALLRRAVEETDCVGRAVHPDLPDLVEKAWRFLKALPGNVHASMLDDLNRGRRLELNHLSGEVVRLGRRHGIPTPVHETVTAALQPFVEGAPAPAGPG